MEDGRWEPPEQSVASTPGNRIMGAAETATAATVVKIDGRLADPRKQKKRGEGGRQVREGEQESTNRIALVGASHRVATHFKGSFPSSPAWQKGDRNSTSLANALPCVRPYKLYYKIVADLDKKAAKPHRHRKLVTGRQVT